MVIWREQYVLEKGRDRWGVITIALDVPFHGEPEPDPVSFDEEWMPLYLSSFKVEPFTPEHRLTNYDHWKRSVHESWARQGWHWSPPDETGARRMVRDMPPPKKT